MCRVCNDVKPTLFIIGNTLIHYPLFSCCIDCAKLYFDLSVLRYNSFFNKCNRCNCNKAYYYFDLRWGTSRFSIESVHYCQQCFKILTGFNTPEDIADFLYSK